MEKLISCKTNIKQFKDKSSLTIMIAYVKINGYSYRYHNPTDYNSYKEYLKILKRVRCKIRARQNGSYEGKNDYKDYPLFLEFLEGLVKR